MAWPHRIWAVLLLAAAACAVDQPSSPTPGCADGVPGAAACTVTKQSRKDAKTAFERGMKLQHEKKLDAAYEQFQRAAQLVPTDVQYVTLKELLRQQLVFNHLQSGNAALTGGKLVEALFAQQRQVN